MAVTPSQRLVNIRELLQREFAGFQALSGERLSYGAGLAEWLVVQLPGADPAALGWGTIAVTGQLLPSDPMFTPRGPQAKPGARGGQRFSILLASRVGEALLSAGAQVGRPAATSFEIGPELSQFDMSGVFIEFTGLPSSQSPGRDAAQLRREFIEHMADELHEIRQCLTGELPGADQAAIGWGLIGTGMGLMVQEGKVAAKPKGWRRSTRQRNETARGSALSSAILLACIGDYLVNPEA